MTSFASSHAKIRQSQNQTGPFSKPRCLRGSLASWIALGAMLGCSSNSGIDANGSGGGFSVGSAQGGSNGTGSTNGTGSNSSMGGAGANSSTGTGTGLVPPGCSIGSQGCYCDTIGGCVTGQTCNNGVCCEATTGDCTPSSSTTTGAGGSTSTYTGGSTDTSTGTTTGTSTTTCTPGVTGPMVLDCGYPVTTNSPLTSTVFNESTVLVAIVPTGGSYAKISVFYGDEHALTLGVRSVVVKSSSGTTTTDYPVSALPSSALPSSPGSVMNPQTGSNVLYGDQAGLDPSWRPMWPALFITDITNDPNNRNGDWQYGGRPYNPSAVYGTWKAAVRTVDTTVSPSVVTITPDGDPSKNNWDLGTGADPLPSTVGKNEGYGAEVVWNLALIPGHSYRVQAMVHDGDQNKVGGDSGEACVDFCAGGETGQPDGGTGGGGGTPPPPECEPGTAYCGSGNVDLSDCPDGYICINGCCIWNVG